MCMNSLRLYCIFLLLSLVLICGCNKTGDEISNDISQQDVKEKEYVCNYEAVPLIRLLATPERYVGKKICTTGYLLLKYEDYGLYLSEDEYKKGGFFNRLGIAGDLDNFKQFDGKMVGVCGILLGEFKKVCYTFPVIEIEEVHQARTFE